MKFINWQFRERRYPSQICVIPSRKMAAIKSKFTEFSNMWREGLTDELIDKWEKWVKGQAHYKSGRGAFIGLNMVAWRCGMITPRLNPPTQEQFPPAKPTGLWLSYAFDRVIAGCEVGKFGDMESAKLRLWFNAPPKIHKQIVAMVDIRNCDNPTIFVESISSGIIQQILLTDFPHLTIKAQTDVVVATSPDTAPLVSEPSNEVSVRIVN